MSGFDVAGIILGVFPLAITALEKYREVAVRLGLFNKIKLEYRKCSNELELQQLIFTRHLKQLLLPLVADNGKVQELINNPAGEAWKDASIVELLRTRLKDSYELYIEYMKGMEHVMDKLQKELAVDADFVQSKLADSSVSIASSGSRVETNSGRNAQRPGRGSNLFSAEMTCYFSFIDSNSATASPFEQSFLRSCRPTTTSSRSSLIRATRSPSLNNKELPRSRPVRLTAPFATSGCKRRSCSRHSPRHGSAIAATSTVQSCCSSTGWTKRWRLSCSS